METKVCKKCLEEKQLCEFYKQKRNKDGYWNSCIVCEKNKYIENSENIKKRVSNYRKNNKEKVSECKKKHYYINREKILEQKKIYTDKTRKIRNKKRYEKYHSNTLFKIMNNMRTRMRIFMKSKNIKKNNKTIIILGAEPQTIKEHIEKQFKDGMSWENYGYYGWHIDHIIPLSSANTEEDVFKLCHYTNLQPLWCGENYKKGKKIL
jgi:hypothetical protein